VSTVDLAARADLVRARIAAAGGDPARVRLLAVSKGHPVAAVRAAVTAGLHDLGESYAQELAATAEALAEDPTAPSPRWHAIGGLQRNKVRLIAPHVHLWQSVDRLSLAGEIARRAPGAAVLVQVNVSGAEQQGGCPPAQAASVVEGCRDLGLEVRGLMAIGPRGEPAEVRAGFRLLRELADRLELPERSMGMSGDLELAVAEGSTMVRVGTDLFGPRPRRGGVGQ
jgi:pyridoxal phosphate enzyme (YggS family)